MGCGLESLFGHNKYEYVKQIGCATVLMSKHLNITLSISTIAEDKYNGVKNAAGYVGSNPTIFTTFERVQATGW